MTIRTPIVYSDIVEIVEPENNGEGGIKVATLRSKIALEPGQLILKTPLTYPAPLYPTRDFTTVQIEDKGHMKFENEFEYMNHSCAPTAALTIDVDPESGAANVNIKVLKPIAPGQDITFFYPSTELEMDEPFDCWCGAPTCIKHVSGARAIPLADLEANHEVWGITDYTLKQCRGE
ncbi:uncharacterized protein SAPINGB_P005594 [Magnusiomyces paraingens]|uniref:SET domain-containing protein n=1 Tax=Magnusiomyces paraingens TaxID=2606893 RepID=A0A5E8C2J7_9ASCO|nr:uncharacterized protein SAPINGB_P005594 [Saprochaete ingens]VVT57220.1 unnamed protein product [Saprochaete ingens]